MYYTNICSCVLGEKHFRNLGNIEKRVLTEKEWELIESIRNLKKTKHNYSIQFELYVRELFEILLHDDED